MIPYYEVFRNNWRLRLEFSSQSYRADIAVDNHSLCLGNGLFGIQRISSRSTASALRGTERPFWSRDIRTANRIARGEEGVPETQDE